MGADFRRSIEKLKCISRGKPCCKLTKEMYGKSYKNIVFRHVSNLKMIVLGAPWLDFHIFCSEESSSHILWIAVQFTVSGCLRKKLRTKTFSDLPIMYGTSPSYKLVSVFARNAFEFFDRAPKISSHFTKNQDFFDRPKNLIRIFSRLLKTPKNIITL